MDLSKVTLPTFILEPRSLLEKFADYYYHCNILSRAARCDDALTRMKEVVRWYVSGFYKTPKGVKKPYNPILGEKFRCYWLNEETKSRTFYIAEQISHHPPVSAFYVTNRQDGFSISCAVLAKSKFYGNSVSAVMDGPFMGSSDSSNKISGKIKFGHETLFTLDGRWDQEVFLKDKSTGHQESLWRVDNETLSNRLKRFTVPLDCQEEFESERLWQHVGEALRSADQEKATHEKFLLEEAQRNAAKGRKLTNSVHKPALFEVDKMSGNWIYKYSDLRPWDPVNDITQYEQNFKVMTHTKHRTALVRQMSIVNVSSSEQSSRGKGRHTRQLRGRGTKVSDSSTPSHVSDTEEIDEGSSTKDDSQLQPADQRVRPSSLTEESSLNIAISRQTLQETHDRLRNLQSIVVQMAAEQQRGITLHTRDWLLLALILSLQAFLQFLFSKI
ncbi:OSBPL8 [Bugula neritina]|uniref:Oxysterol-binding protein n=1 Tax=Bugula neritina TaxID=10212 RepID=A0A7J7K7B4_BUGNE|nr:OSBPL8 [Bugula neritina]